MSSPLRIAVEPRPYGYWAIQRNGALAEAEIFSTKSKAVARAREEAERHHAELVVKAQDGHIEALDDPVR